MMSNIIHEYTRPDGSSPYADWLASIRNKTVQARIIMHVDRLELGLFGDSKPIGAGLSELRVHFGPGYRVYYAKESEDIYLILCGGDKSNQIKDIKKAQAWWKEYKLRNRHDP